MTCRYMPCRCREKMGNDFWMLPADRCLYTFTSLFPDVIDGPNGTKLYRRPDLGIQDEVVYASEPSPKSLRFEREACGTQE